MPLVDVVFFAVDKIHSGGVVAFQIAGRGEFLEIDLVRIMEKGEFLLEDMAVAALRDIFANPMLVAAKGQERIPVAHFQEPHDLVQSLRVLEIS